VNSGERVLIECGGWPLFPLWTNPAGLLVTTAAAAAFFTGVVPLRLEELCLLTMVAGVTPLIQRMVGVVRIQVTETGIRKIRNGVETRSARHEDMLGVHAILGFTFLSFRQFWLYVPSNEFAGPRILEFYAEREARHAGRPLAVATGAEVEAPISAFRFPDTCYGCGYGAGGARYQLSVRSGFDIPFAGSYEVERSVELPACPSCQGSFNTARRLVFVVAWAALTAVVMLLADDASLFGAPVVTLIGTMILMSFRPERRWLERGIFGVQVVKHTDLSLLKLRFRSAAMAEDVAARTRNELDWA
jgi:hypothetical protein